MAALRTKYHDPVANLKLPDLGFEHRTPISFQKIIIVTHLWMESRI